jgi:hypothetical protein
VPQHLKRTDEAIELPPRVPFLKRLLARISK